MYIYVPIVKWIWIKFLSSIYIYISSSLVARMRYSTDLAELWSWVFTCVKTWPLYKMYRYPTKTTKKSSLKIFFSLFVHRKIEKLFASLLAVFALSTLAVAVAVTFCSYKSWWSCCCWQVWTQEDPMRWDEMSWQGSQGGGRIAMTHLSPPLPLIWVTLLYDAYMCMHLFIEVCSVGIYTSI